MSIKSAMSLLFDGENVGFLRILEGDRAPRDIRAGLLHARAETGLPSVMARLLSTDRAGSSSSLQGLKVFSTAASAAPTREVLADVNVEVLALQKRVSLGTKEGRQHIARNLHSSSSHSRPGSSTS